MDMARSPFAGNPEAEILADFAPRLAVKWRLVPRKASAMVWKPNVTVASVLEREGRFLLVEEETEYGVCYNQPAGHLECGESLIDAVIRETLEETAYRLNPQYLVGIYNYRNEARDVTYLRFAFGGEISAHDPGRPLDEGILAAHWLTLDRNPGAAGAAPQSAGAALHRGLAGRQALSPRVAAPRDMRWLTLCLLLSAATAAIADTAATVKVCLQLRLPGRGGGPLRR
jgi:ADP-ribose pyrophosphatase YjhB (NUDIX family)